MCKKVNLSISPEVDSFLSNMKQKHNISKSKVLTALVLQYGDKIDKNLCKYSKKGDTEKSVSAFIE